MDLIESLKQCLRFDEPNTLETESEKLIREAIKKLQEYEAALSGWESYAWKDGEYIDDVQEYFDKIKS